MRKASPETMMIFAFLDEYGNVPYSQAEAYLPGIERNRFNVTKHAWKKSKEGGFKKIRPLAVSPLFIKREQFIPTLEQQKDGDDISALFNQLMVKIDQKEKSLATMREAVLTAMKAA